MIFMESSGDDVSRLGRVSHPNRRQMHQARTFTACLIASSFASLYLILPAEALKLPT